jgi:hypothetical protein
MSSPTTPASTSLPSTAPPLPTVAESATPERAAVNRQFMPMSSPAPFYRYSSITTPISEAHERSSPPSSGAIDLAETLVEFSSPIKFREQSFPRTISMSSEHDESPSRPIRNGIKSSSLGDLQGVDLLRGFEKISSWRKGSTPGRDSEITENGFGKELKRFTGRDGVNGNGVIIEEETCIDKDVTALEEEMDSQMTDVKMESEVRKLI